MLPSWCGDTITVTRAPWATQRGAKVRDWANAETHEVSGCSVQYADTATGDRSGRAQATSARAVVYCPPGADVQAGDRIGFGGSSFDLEGVPLTVSSPFGGCSHVLLSVTERRG